MPLTHIHCSRHGNVARSDGAMLCPICEAETDHFYPLRPTYPPLPTIAAMLQGETLQSYGVRILTFVVREQVTATLTDRQLELADHFYPLAVSGQGILPVAVDRLSVARTAILQCLKSRASVPKSAPISTSQHPTLDGGHLVPVLPRPLVQPPAPVAIVTISEAAIVPPFAKAEAIDLGF